MSQNVPLHGFGNGNAPTVMQVICNTIRPAKPHEKMIWVNSPNAMTKCTFSGERPSDPVSGEVWLRIGNSGSVKVSTPIGKDWITVYPLSAEQYISFEWVSVPAMSYQYGEWVNWWNGELYIYGNEYGHTTGGWTSKEYRVDDSSTYTPKVYPITKNEDHIALSVDFTKNTSTIICHNEPIDLTEWSTIKIEFEASTSAANSTSMRLQVCDTALSGKSLANTVIFNAAAVTGSNTVDISGLSGECIVGVAVWAWLATHIELKIKLILMK